tara:strand:- start:1078 stop:1827 length:750 start_codon:yes stop_codon:yes gene_type:complete
LIISSKAIVLNKRNFGDTSLICSLFTSEQGKVSIIAKGARTKKNPHSAILQPLNYIDLVYYYKNKRNIQTLKEASLITNHLDLDCSYENFLYALTVVDIINSINLEDNPCDIIFRLTLQSIKKINKCDLQDITIYYVFFQLQLLIYLGYQPNWLNCYSCSNKITCGFFDNKTCHILCANCKQNQCVKLNPDILSVFQFISTTHIDIIVKKNQYNQILYSEINSMLYKFIKLYLPQIKSCKTFHQVHLYE